MSTKIHFIGTYKIEGVDNYTTLSNALEYLRDKKIIGLDIETSRKFPKEKYLENVYKGGLDPYLSRVVMLQVGDLENVFVIDMRCFTLEELKPLSEYLDYRDNLLIVGQNLRFEQKHLKHTLGINFKNVWDTMIVEMTLTNGLSVNYGLAVLAEKYLDVKKKKENVLFEELYDDKVVTLDEEYLKEYEHALTPFEVENDFQIDKSTRLEFINIGNRPFTAKQVLYGADDIIMPILIRQRQLLGRKLETGEIYNPKKWQKLENKYLLFLADMELNGMNVNVQMWKDLHDENEVIYYERLAKLNDYVIKTYPEYVSNNYDLFSGELACKIKWTGSTDVINFFKKLDICPRAYSKQTKKVEYTIGATELVKTLPNKLKGNYMKNKDVEITDLDTLKLAFLLFKKSEQAITTFGKGWLKYIHPITGRVHSNYRQILNTTRISSTNPNCLSIDTEVLTPNGWKKYNEVNVGDKIYSYNKDKELIEEETITNYYRGESEVIEATGNRNYNAKLTPNHRNLFKDRKTGEYKVRPTTEFKKDAHIINSSILNKGIKLDSNFIKLIVVTQADGYKDGKYKKQYRTAAKRKEILRYRYIFRKKRKYNRLKSILESTNLKYTDTSKENNYQLVVYYPLDYFDGYLVDKNFTYKLLDLDLETRQLLLKELMYWDGSFSRKNNYSSSIEINIDVIQSLATISNIRTKKREYRNTTPKAKINYQLDFVWNQNYTGTANTVLKERGVEEVWCVEVPNSFIICRRGNSSSFITGNCQNISGGKWRDCFEVPEGKVMVNADYSSQEVRVLAEICQDEALIDFFVKGDETFGDDFHSFTATKVFRILEDNPDLLVPRKELSNGENNPEFTSSDAEKRTDSKTATFGLAFGKSDYGFSQDFGISVEEAKKFVQSYLDAFPGLKQHFDKCVSLADEQPYVLINPKLDVRWFCTFFDEMTESYNLAGSQFFDDDVINEMGFNEYREIPKSMRAEYKKNLYIKKPHVKELYRSSGRLRGSLVRKNKNYPVQGSAAMCMKIAMVNLRTKNIETGEKFLTIGNIHDEALLESDKIHADFAGKMLKECMEKAGEYITPTVPQISNYVLSKIWEH